MNVDIEDLFYSIQNPTCQNDVDNEYDIRRDIADNYLSYEETIYTGERSKQDSLKKIHDYAKVWGVRNALETLLELLTEPAQGDFDAIVDPDEEPDMVIGENRDKVLDLFYDKFDYDDLEEDYAKLNYLYNVLVDDLLVSNLTDHDLEMVAMRVWDTIW